MMEQIKLPDNLGDLQLVVDSLYDGYQLASRRETRLQIRHDYRTAAEKYNNLAGKKLYCSNINVQKKISR